MIDNLQALQLQITFGTLKEQRDEAIEHTRLCLYRHDLVAASYWANIYRDTVADMNNLIESMKKLRGEKND